MLEFTIKISVYALLLALFEIKWALLLIAISVVFTRHIVGLIMGLEPLALLDLQTIYSTKECPANVISVSFINDSSLPYSEWKSNTQKIFRPLLR